MLKKIFIFILLLGNVALQAQIKKRHFRQKEIGLFGGASYYIGDINQRAHFLYSKPAAGIFFRQAMSYRYAFRFGFNYGSVWGNDAKSGEPDQLERNLNFKSNIYDLHALYEFNFVDYRIGNNNHYFTMFVFAGLGGYYFNPQGNVGTGYKNLSEQNTEGQSKSYSKYQVNLPFGVGIKWNITEWIGLGFEWAPRKLFTDYLDDVSHTYPTTGTIFTGSGIPGSMRGNPRTKDWYFFYGFTAQIRMPKKNIECRMGN